MKCYYITFRSVTLAQRGEAELNRRRITCSLQRTPRWMEAQGCGYALRLWTDMPQLAAGYLRDAGITLRRVYQQRTDGHLEELRI